MQLDIKTYRSPSGKTYDLVDRNRDGGEGAPLIVARVFEPFYGAAFIESVNLICQLQDDAASQPSQAIGDWCNKYQPMIDTATMRVEREQLPDDRGVWFVSAVSGLRYRNRKAAGGLAAIIVDGERFAVGEYAEQEG